MSAPIATHRKAPSEVIKYELDWTAWLEGDTISTSSWTVDAGISKDSDGKTSVIAHIVVSGGSAYAIYRATNTIVTAGGFTYQRSILISVEPR
jgi:hypothetical protein